MKTITRRQFGVSAAALATAVVTGVTLPRISLAEPESGGRRFAGLPLGLRYGCLPD